LTGRETAALRLLCWGTPPTRSVTASAVLLAPSERQLEHIHRKLEVNERLSAAQRAAAMDIPPNLLT
jgi:hypothetical protein